MALLRAHKPSCQECPRFRYSHPKPPKATTKPYTRHILGIDSGVQSHLKATTKPPQSYHKATPRPHQGHTKATSKPGYGQVIGRWSFGYPQEFPCPPGATSGAGGSPSARPRWERACCRQLCFSAKTQTVAARNPSTTTPVTIPSGMRPRSWYPPRPTVARASVAAPNSSAQLHLVAVRRRDGAPVASPSQPR